MCENGLYVPLSANTHSALPCFSFFPFCVCEQRTADGGSGKRVKAKVTIDLDIHEHMQIRGRKIKNGCIFSINLFENLKRT